MSKEAQIEHCERYAILALECFKYDAPISHISATLQVDFGINYPANILKAALERLARKGKCISGGSDFDRTYILRKYLSKDDYRA